MIYLIVILTVVIVAVFFIPIKVVIDSNLIGNNVYYVDNLKRKNDITIVIKVLGVIPIYRYNNNERKVKNIKKQNNQKLEINEVIEVLKDTFSNKDMKVNDLIEKIFKLIKKVNFNKLVIIGGFNTEDYVKNAYINASINSIICTYINANQERFNLNKLYYQVSISDYKYYLTLDTVLSFKLFNNINIFKTIIGIIRRLKKKKKEKQKENSDLENTNIKIDKNYDFTWLER